MKIVYFFLLLCFSAIQVHAKDECSKLVKKDCMKVSKCRWSKPNKACVVNYTASNTTNRPTDLYSTKNGAGMSSRKDCSELKKSACSGRPDCMWNDTNNNCIDNPDAPVMQQQQQIYRPEKEKGFDPSK